MAVDPRSRRAQFITFVCCSIALSMVAAGPPTAGPRQDPRDAAPTPPPVGTSRISGQLVAADNGAPVKRATVSIAGRFIPPAGRGATGGVVGGAQVRISTPATIGGGQYPGWSQMTDDAGRFELRDLPAGMYSIMVSPRSGFVRPPPRQVEVEEGKSATVAIRLERTGVITGRLLDESGDPLARARVTAMRRERAGSGRPMPTGMGATTDDLGQFRLFDLPAGEYFVTASDMNYAPSMNTGGPSQGYAPTYFPGSASLDGARSVIVKSALETPGIEFSLLRVSMGRFTGTLRDSSGQVVTTRGNVTLARRDDFVMGFTRGGSVRPDGSFTIAEIPPGEYYVVASLQNSGGPDAPREGAYVPVSVNGNETSVDIQTNKGATLRGRVIVEGTPTPLPPSMAARPEASRITVSARPMGMSGGLSMVSNMSRPATVNEDGTFELTGVRGPVLLTASGMQLAFKSAMSGAEDLTARPIEFKGTERASNVTIVVTYDVGTVEGMVTDERGEPLPAAAIIIFPEDDSRWFQGSPFVRVSRALPAMAAGAMRPPQTSPTPGALTPQRPARVPGSFISSGLLPGRYFVAAFDSEGMQSMPAMDHDSLERLRKHAVVATVTAGTAATLQLRAVKAF